MKSDESILVSPYASDVVPNSEQSAERVPTTTRDLQVIHVGVVGDLPGGMAQVVAEYLSWSYNRCTVSGLRSTKGKGGAVQRFSPQALWMWIHCFWVVGRNRIKRTQFIVVIHMSQGGSFAREGTIAAFARLIGVPVALQLHGSSFADFARRHSTIVRHVLRIAGTIFVLTEETETLVRSILGADSRPRIVSVKNAVRVPACVAPKEQIILFAGEIASRKGADILLEAWSGIVAQSVGWRLILAGPLADNFQIPNDLPCVEYVGSLPRESVLELESKASIAVLPSRNEALPMFLIESMAHECAVVSTPVGQISELLNGVGVVTPVGDARALADALEHLINNETVRRSLGSLARNRVVQTYSDEVACSELEGEWVRLAGTQWSK